MIKVPPIFKIFLLNFVAGITATIVILISELLVFGLGRPIFTLSPIKEPLDLPEPPPSHPIEWQAIGILIFVLYFCLIIFVNKSFISDSPYK
ncbi:MAG: hypothetical protein K0R47_3589, partial [Brevibacillus sp.]|nr:hypothetical protein [Brevibacillus sp.]